MFFIGFRSCSDKFDFYTRNHSHKQSSLLDTIFNYIFILDLHDNIYRQVEKTTIRRPASPADDSGFGGLKYRRSPGDPNRTYS